MMLNNYEAGFEIRKLFNDAWVLKIGALNLKRRNSSIPYVPRVIWNDVEETYLNDNGIHWADFRLRNTSTRQDNLSGARIEEIGTVYETHGVAIINLYFSKSAYRTEDKENVEVQTQSIFFKQRTPGGVWFRNPTIYQLKAEENFFRSMVTANYVFNTMV